MRNLRISSKPKRLGNCPLSCKALAPRGAGVSIAPTLRQATVRSFHNKPKYLGYSQTFLRSMPDCVSKTNLQSGRVLKARYVIR